MGISDYLIYILTQARVSRFFFFHPCFLQTSGTRCPASKWRRRQLWAGLFLPLKKLLCEFAVPFHDISRFRWSQTNDWQLNRENDGQPAPVFVRVVVTGGSELFAAMQLVGCNVEGEGEWKEVMKGKEILPWLHRWQHEHMQL